MGSHKLSTEDQELVRAYLANFLSESDEEQFWAYESMNALVRSDPERAWRVTLEMLKPESEPLFRAYVAAGPLEDLLALHGPVFIERTEALAATEGWFLESLQSIYLPERMPVEIRARIKRVCGDDA